MKILWYSITMMAVILITGVVLELSETQQVINVIVVSTAWLILMLDEKGSK